jgi:hypothetical protein
LTSYTPAGKNGIFSGQINMTAKPKDDLQKNNRSMDPTMPRPTPSLSMMGQQTGPQSQSFNTNIQLDRTAPDMLSQLKGNPFAISHLGGL